MKRIKGKRGIWVVILLLLAAFVYLLINTAAILSYSKVDEARPADVAIVLGAGLGNGQVSPVFRERINHGIDLYKNGYVAKLIITGGVGEGSTYSDAYVGKQYAISQGVPDADILCEEKSTVTEENLRYAKVIMDREGWDTAIVVSDPLHMKRAMRMAEDAGMTAYSSPTPTSRYVSVKKKLEFLGSEVVYYTGYQFKRLFQ